ncbi:Uncharacterised protein [Enterobacter hormaechei]|nr:Uncharacterised protein [Enterobacter hormaechei]CZX74253.1 Uncharacterised protein [Enterobacter hormaechei]
MDSYSVNASLNYFCKWLTRTTGGDDFLSSEPLILIMLSGSTVLSSNTAFGIITSIFPVFILEYVFIAVAINKIATQ